LIKGLLKPRIKVWLHSSFDSFDKSLI
jgi:hypothetical protein